MLWSFWLPVVFFTLILFFRKAKKYFQSFTHRQLKVAFFHPYCNDGGGGERVLWQTIKTLQLADKNDNILTIVYTGDTNFSPPQILDNAKNNFGIEIPKHVQFVYLKSRFLVEAKRWPKFTMIMQSLASMVLGLEAVVKNCPDIYIDTMGYSFTYPIFNIIGGCTVVAYVHYPTISTDMLEKVSSRIEDFNNNQSISNSSIKTSLKLRYYRWFAMLYYIMGKFCSLIILNSSWTKDHIVKIWKPHIKRTYLVYPPVDCSALKKFPLEGRKNVIISIGQFRREKNHALQIESLHKAIEKYGLKDLQLVMIGSVREHEKEDQERVEILTEQINKLGLQKNVKIVKNASREELHKWLRVATAGIHTMKDEHFGIGIVELMSAGVIPIANDSAGPKADIVVPFEGHNTGFLATTAEEYAEKIYEIFNNPEQAKEIQKYARLSAERFSDEQYSEQILTVLKDIRSIEIILDTKKDK